MVGKPGRKIIQWVKDDQLSRLKALAAVIFQCEALQWDGTIEEREERLWIRVKEEVPNVFHNDTTMHDLCDHAEKISNGQVLTPHKLWDRADKTLREPHEAKAIKEQILDVCDDLEYVFNFKDPFLKGPKITKTNTTRAKFDDRPLTSAETAEVRELLRTRPWEPNTD